MVVVIEFSCFKGVKVHCLGGHVSEECAGVEDGGWEVSLAFYFERAERYWGRLCLCIDGEAVSWDLWLWIVTRDALRLTLLNISDSMVWAFGMNLKA